MEAQALLEQLMDSRGDADIMEAARELAPRKGLAPHAARLLVDLLNTGTAPRAAAAAFVLGEWGDTALGTAPGLVTSLRQQTAHHNVTVRHWCVAALMRFGPRAAPAVPELTVCLRDADDGVRAVAAHALGELAAHARPALDALVEMVYDPSDDVRRAAVAAVARVEPHGKKSVASIARGLSSPSARVRTQSAEALGGLRTIAAPAAPALTACLTDPNANVRARAVAAIARVLPAERALLQSLALALRDRDDDVRAGAIDALALFEHNAAAAAPHLMAALRDRDPRVRARAIELLEKFSPSLGPMVSAVSVAIGNCLRDPSELVQARAVKASGSLAHWTHRADPRLVNALYHADAGARVAAALALAGSHNDPAAIDALRFRLGDDRADVRVAVCHALAACGVASGVILPTLVHALADSDTAIQLEAIAILERLGPGAIDALDSLRAKTNDSNPRVRAAAARLVSSIER